jgi:hypothetical protein
MQNTRAAAIAFLAACAADLLMAAWVSAVAMGERWRAGLLSMAVATCVLAGIGQTLKCSRRAVWFAWIFGYGVGSWIAVTVSH